MKIVNYLIIILIIGFASCDPIYPITLTNSTNDTIKISIDRNANVDLKSEKYLVKNSVDSNLDTYIIPPNEILSLDKAIAELNNDIEFNNLYIYREDSITHIFGKDKILKMFDKGLTGPQKPYNITIK